MRQRQRAEALESQWFTALAWADGTVSAAEAARIQLWLGLFPVNRHQLAEQLGIIGTAAVLVLAKERGLVPACAPLLNALRSEGYYLSDSIVAAVLDQVGEPVAGL